MKKTMDLKEIVKYYAEYTLTEYLKTLSDEELQHILVCILCDDIIDERVNIYSAVKNEIEYRESDKALSSRTK